MPHSAERRHALVWQVNAVRLELDTAASAGWSKIDAVRLMAHPWGGDHVAWSEFQHSSAPVTSSSTSTGRSALSDLSNGRAPITRPCTATRTSYNLSASEVKLRTRVEVRSPTDAASEPPLCARRTHRRCPRAQELESALANLRVEKASARGFNKQQRKEQPDCVICWENSATMVMVPCGHMCMCRGCAGAWCKSHSKPADARYARVAEPASTSLVCPICALDSLGSSMAGVRSAACRPRTRSTCSWQRAREGSVQVAVPASWQGPIYHRDDSQEQRGGCAWMCAGVCMCVRVRLSCVVWACMRASSVSRCVLCPDHLGARETSARADNDVRRGND